MKAPIIGQKVNSDAIDSLIDLLDSFVDINSTFYVGYPVAASIDVPITVPALLISETYGLICFDVVPSAKLTNLQDLKNRQRKITVALKSKLLQHPDLTDEDDLAFKISTITYALTADKDQALTAARIADSTTLMSVIKQNGKPFPPAYLTALNAAIERVANIRPKIKREAAKIPSSKGSILRKIESEVANLDSWQKAAAIEIPDGPQRIRGLAGSGKTIVLALKAAYLHGHHSDWRIGLTFHTRALKQQLSTLIKRFYFEDYREEPNETTLQVMHSFGSLGERGIYSEICRAYGVAPKDFGYAKRTYGYDAAFQGICAELLTIVQDSPKVLFDALLIDEAQDLPREFLRLAYLCTRDHRVVWAYDDLQNLGEYQMRSLRETFGEDKEGKALVSLRNEPKQAKQDIILPKCYRNTPWALVTAHTLGSGIYRDPKMVQHPDDPLLWGEIGYEVVEGDLKLGQRVVLQRSADSSPRYFQELMTAEDAVRFHYFENETDQFVAVARMINEDLTTGELYPHDIAVVFPEAISAEKRGALFRQYLFDHGIESHMVGVTSSRDGFLLDGKVAISGPYRAKGNEAPVVYVMDADYCATAPELIKKRNILFTAITRSRGWVRVCGCGQGMLTLQAEFDRLIAKNFSLDFTIPTPDELQKMRTLYRDVTSDERKKAADLQKAFERLPDNIEEANAVLQTIPKSLRERIIRSLSDIED